MHREHQNSLNGFLNYFGNNGDKPGITIVAKAKFDALV